MEKFEMLIICLCIFGICIAEQPTCSRFDFEKDLLEKLVRFEFNIDKMTEKVAEIEGRVGTLEEKQHGQDVAIQNISEKIQIRDLYGHDAAKTNVMLEKIQHLEKQLVTVIANREPRVGFFAIYANSQLMNDRPIFQRLLYNDGDSYNVSTGIFTCRVAGLYHFTFTFMSKSEDYYSKCQLYLNDSRLVYTSAIGQYDSSTMTVYHNFNVGDTVYARCSSWNSVYSGDDSTWFTGTLIHAF